MNRVLEFYRSRFIGGTSNWGIRDIAILVIICEQSAVISKMSTNLVQVIYRLASSTFPLRNESIMWKIGLGVAIETGKILGSAEEGRHEPMTSSIAVTVE
jgi:hypothetical protein